MNEVSTCGIFEGETGHMVFTHSLPLITGRKYEMCGRLLQWSLAHGGPGLPVLSPAVYWLSHGIATTVSQELEHVPDASVRDNIKVVSRAVQQEPYFLVSFTEIVTCSRRVPVPEMLRRIRP